MKKVIVTLIAGLLALNMVGCGTTGSISIFKLDTKTPERIYAENDNGRSGSRIDTQSIDAGLGIVAVIGGIFESFKGVLSIGEIQWGACNPTDLATLEILNAMQVDLGNLKIESENLKDDIISFSDLVKEVQNDNKELSDSIDKLHEDLKTSGALIGE